MDHDEAEQLELKQHNDGNDRPVKRPKAAKAAGLSRDRRLFAPFRALGIVTNDVPFAVQSRSSKDLSKPAITAATCTGKSWALWDLVGPTRLLFVGSETQSPISALAIEGDYVYAAAGACVFQYSRGKQIGVFHTRDDNLPSTSSSPSGHASGPSPTVSSIIIFGQTMCGLSSDGRNMYTWDLSQRELLNTIQFDDDFTASKVVHPATYMNKVVVASREGALQLWNVSTMSLIYCFDASTFSTTANVLSRQSAITCVSQSPAIDVLAIGFADGRIIIFDIRTGDILLQFKMSVDTSPNSRTQAHVHEVTSLSFRTDNEAQTLASSDAAGNIAIWNLDSGGSLLSVLRRAHAGRISSLQFLPGQALLVSSGEDNALRQWAFETPTAAPKLLKERSGHHSPPSCVRYYGSDGKAMLSASRGDRTLRYTSVVRDSRSFELSQGSLAAKSSKLGIAVDALKLSPISSIAYAGQGSGMGGTGAGSIVTREWDDVVTCHIGEGTAYSWSVENKRLGKLRLRDGKAADAGAATAACVTACGNFTLVGYERARDVAMWNLQSGIQRRAFRLPITKGSVLRSQHVTGIQTDALNTNVVIATLSGTLHYFDFHTAKHLGSTALPAGITSTILQRDNNLLACVCDDYTVRIIDIETRRIVRDFTGYRGRVVDITFSHDSRWLVVASTDSIIRTFDVPTGQLIDAFRTVSVATSLTFSPTGDFLATAHVDSIGVFLWANRAQFSDVQLRTVDEEELLRGQSAVLPTLQADEPEQQEADLPTELEDASTNAYTHILASNQDEQLAGDLATLSLLPRSKWQTLINLETINARNKPKQPPKAPEKAPFFLPTLPGTKTRFDTSINGKNGYEKNAKNDAPPEAGSHRLAFGDMEVESDLLRLLRQEESSSSYDVFFSRLFALSPASLDLEIRSLTGDDQLALFMQAATQRIISRKDFEAVQAVLNTFLAIHTDALTSSDTMSEGGIAEEEQMNTDGREGVSLSQSLIKLLEAQERETKTVGSLVRTGLGLVAWARGVPVV